MKKRLIIFLTFIKTVLLLGQNDTDTIGYYYNGRISCDWKMIENQKQYENHTILLQVKFPSGKTHKEFFRYNDSTFLYTEYYDIKDTLKFNHIYREGLVSISNYSTGDTIILIDPMTYERKIYLDTLLLPINTWKYRYPNGKTMKIGSYENYKKNGEWIYFDEFGNKEKIILYKNGEEKSIDFENKLIKNNYNEIKEVINGIWIIHDKEANGGILNTKYDSYRFLYKLTEKKGIGDIYEFKAGNSLNYTKTKIIQTNYKNEDNKLIIMRKYDVVENKVGWYSINLNTLQINTGEGIQNFEIEYLSGNHMRLKVKK